MFMTFTKPIASRRGSPRVRGLWRGAIAMVASLTALAPAQDSTPASGAQPAGRPRLGILEIQATPSLAEKVARQGADAGLSLRRVTESLDGQLLDNLNTIKMYELVARRDLEVLLKDQDLQQVFSANPVAAFKIARCDYGLVLTLDDFNDEREDLMGEGRQAIATKRTVRLSAVAKIYDIEKGTLVSTASFVVGPESMSSRIMPGVKGAGDDQFGELLTKVSRDFAQQASRIVLDSTRPASVVSVVGKQVAINRGRGTGIEPGQEWVVYARGEVITDPDTGEVLGSAEVQVGRVRIQRVEERLAWGEAVEDYGIARGAIARLPRE
ncbi:MAG: hypothetical protein RBS39_08435 [Phycisphaerales bacterium]|jgi:hypothetical protein|nr:hypothetical protein [Phycisphaerales bacterium]